MADSPTRQRVAKIVYATCLTGQVIKIPIPENWVQSQNPGYFAQFLLDEGVSFADLDNV